MTDQSQPLNWLPLQAGKSVISMSTSLTSPPDLTGLRKSQLSMIILSLVHTGDFLLNWMEIEVYSRQICKLLIPKVHLSHHTHTHASNAGIMKSCISSKCLRWWCTTNIDSRLWQNIMCFLMIGLQRINMR